MKNTNSPGKTTCSLLVPLLFLSINEDVFKAFTDIFFLSFLMTEMNLVCRNTNEVWLIKCLFHVFEEKWCPQRLICWTRVNSMLNTLSFVWFYQNTARASRWRLTATTAASGGRWRLKAWNWSCCTKGGWRVNGFEPGSENDWEISSLSQLSVTSNK